MDDSDIKSAKSLYLREIHVGRDDSSPALGTHLQREKKGSAHLAVRPSVRDGAGEGDCSSGRSRQSLSMLEYHAGRAAIASRPTGDDHRAMVRKIRARCLRSASGCLEWVGAGSTSGKGYGRIKFGGKAYLVHRVMLEHDIGRTLAGNEDTCHSCDNPRCCEPDHLFAGSRSANVRDAFRKGRMRPSGFRPVGIRNGSAKLDEASVVVIKSELARGVGTAELAERFGVSRGAIQKIMRGYSWGHLASIEVSP